MEEMIGVSPDDRDPEPERPSSSGHARRGAGGRARLRVPLIIGLGTVAILTLGVAMLVHASAGTNHVALASRPKGVTVVEARAASYRPRRRYVATVEPWVRASVGPQLVAAYVDTVLVRPGAAVKRGEVLATLDCRSASTTSQAVAMRARALEEKQAALAKESARISGLLDGGFVSANEAEQKAAESESMAAQLLATKAQLAGSSLEVNDCVLRAPFDGEIAERMIDPGAFVRPGQPVVSVVDRGTVRVTVDAPEDDFTVVAPGVAARLRLLATGAELSGRVSRRAPSADSATRTIRAEIDLTDPERKIPVGTSAEVTIEVGEPQAVTRIPLAAAQVRGPKATIFVVTDGKAHLTRVAVKGESGGDLFLDPELPAGAQVVLEGRGMLDDGDAVAAKPLAPKENP